MQLKSWPEWCKPGMRYYDTHVNYLWSVGKQYDHLEYSFDATKDSKGNPLLIAQKRPSVQLNIPALGTRMMTRKLFVGSRCPSIVTANDNETVDETTKDLIKASKLFWNAQEFCKLGGAGSVAAILSYVKGRPKIEVVPGKKCWPLMNEADELDRVDLIYPIMGYEWLNLRNGVDLDCEGNKIAAENRYWFVRWYDTKMIATCYPIPYDDYNPETKRLYDKEKAIPGNDRLGNPFIILHPLEFVPIVWIKNTNCPHEDGAPNWDLALSDCVHLDRTLSQAGRAFNYMGSPVLMQKGVRIGQERGGNQYGMSNVMQLKADTKIGEKSESGHDAKLLEMGGQGLHIGLEWFIKPLKTWVEGLTGSSQKDPHDVKGQMSGIAMILADQPFYDFCDEKKEPFGVQGVVAVVHMFYRMAAILKISEYQAGEEDIDSLEPDWPDLFHFDPQELSLLQTALAGAVTAGFMTTVEGSDVWANALDSPCTAVEPEDNPLLAMPGAEQDSNQEMAGEELKIKQADSKTKAMAVKNKPKAKPAAKKK